MSESEEQLRLRRREKYQENREAAKARARNWYQNNKDRAASIMKEYRAKHLERLKSYQLNLRKTKPIGCMLKKAKTRAKKRGLDFDLTDGDLMFVETCPVLGVPLDWFSSKQSDNSATLDRIDNDKGYVKGNVAIISARANRIKNNASELELRKISEWVSTQVSALSPEKAPVERVSSLGHSPLVTSESRSGQEPVWQRRLPSGLLVQLLSPR